MTDVQRQKKKKNKTTISFYDANFLSFIALKNTTKKQNRAKITIYYTKKRKEK